MTNRAPHDRRAPAHLSQLHQGVSPILKHIGPCRFGRLGAWITVQCPQEFNALMLQAGAVWEPGERRWLLRLHRLSPVLRKLRRQTDRWAGRPMWPQRMRP